MNFSKFGLNEVDSIELSHEDWSFNILGVWKNDQGYYLGTDSGCSCPTPFENYGSIDDFTGPLTASQAIEEATSIFEDARGRYKNELEDLISQIY